jgi:hypothetical protein
LERGKKKKIEFFPEQQKNKKFVFHVLSAIFALTDIFENDFQKNLKFPNASPS